MTSHVETRLKSCNLCQSAHGVHMHYLHLDILNSHSDVYTRPTDLKFFIVVILLSVTTMVEVFTRTPVITMINMVPMVTPLVDHSGRAV
jgi:hypothetical protein